MRVKWLSNNNNKTYTAVSDEKDGQDENKEIWSVSMTKAEELKGVEYV
jgi:hypothetical protein